MTEVTHLSPGRNTLADRGAAALPTLDDLIAANRQVAGYAAAQDRARNLPDLPKPHALAAEQAQRWRDRALWQRGQLLSTSAAEKAATAVRAAFSGPPHPDVISMLVAQLMDCFQTDRLSNPRVFFETLVFDLDEMGFSNATIAAACGELRRTSKFRPSIAEVVERCRAKREYAKGVHAGHHRYVDRLKAVHLVLHHTGGDLDLQEAAAHGLCEDEPLLLAEYVKGSTNEWWFDPTLNVELKFRQTESGEESAEEFEARFLRMKAEAAADPAALQLRIERARGAQAGRRLAWTYHRRLGLARRRDAGTEIERHGLGRYPNRQPGDLYEAWLGGADAAFQKRWDELEPNYDADEQRRRERDARERAERDARLKQFRGRA